MSGFEIGALFEGVKLVLSAVGIPQARRQAFFKDHVTPSYELLGRIHRDYIAKFQEAAALLEERGDVRKVVELLRIERPRNLMDRTEAATLIKGLRDHVMPQNPFPKSLKKPSEFKQLFSMYVFAYEHYLNSASPLDPVKSETWYSYFIRTFEKAVNDGKDPYKETYSGRAGGDRIIDDAAEILFRAVNDVMPDSFKKVQKCYSDLRSHLASRLGL